MVSAFCDEKKQPVFRILRCSTVKLKAVCDLVLRANRATRLGTGLVPSHARSVLWCMYCILLIHQNQNYFSPWPSSDDLELVDKRKHIILSVWFLLAP